MDKLSHPHNLIITFSFVYRLHFSVFKEIAVRASSERVNQLHQVAICVPPPSLEIGQLGGGASTPTGLGTRTLKTCPSQYWCPHCMGQCAGARGIPGVTAKPGDGGLTTLCHSPATLISSVSGTVMPSFKSVFYQCTIWNVK